LDFPASRTMSQYISTQAVVFWYWWTRQTKSVILDLMLFFSLHDIIF
jgi:hypothetical protein